MAMLSECPSAELLQQLLLGKGEYSVAETWNQHLTFCDQCREKADNLPSEDDLILEIRRSVQSQVTVEPEIVSTMISVLRRMAPKPPASTVDAFPDTVIRANSSPLPNLPEIGKIGPYEIHETLGAGGMGVVYRGYDPKLARPIAIKVIRPALLNNAGMKERFFAEARAAAAVENDHIVGVYSVEEHESTSCITMPLLHGETLEHRLRQKDLPIPLKQIIRIARELLSGLQAAHERGLIHRDLKPANLWLERPNDRLKILDFGLAMPMNADEANFAGTPGYMAPEQARGERIDQRADLFSVGCVLYEMASGKQPFDADTPIGLIVATITSSPQPIDEVKKDLPRELARWINQLLAKNPEDRPATALDALQNLEKIEKTFLAIQTRRIRRRWLAGIAGAGVMGILGAWIVFEANKPTPAKPVSVELLADADVGPILLTHDGVDTKFDPAREKVLDLMPGDYRLTAQKALSGRELVPNQLIVFPMESKSIRLALVGEIARSQAHTGAVSGVAVVSEKDQYHVLSSSYDRTLGLWNPLGQEKPKFVNLDSPSQSLAASLDGSVVATAGGNKSHPLDLNIHLFDGKNLVKRGQSLSGHTRRVSALALSSDGITLLSAAPTELLLWNLNTGTSQVLEGHGDRKVTAIAFDPKRKQAITGDEEGFIFLWDLAEAKYLRKTYVLTPGSSGGVTAVAFLPDGFLTTGEDGSIRAWDRETFTSRDLARVDKEKPLRSLAVSRDSKRLLGGGDDGMVRLWSLPEGRLIREFSNHTKAVRSVAFTPDERSVVSGSDDRSVRLWRLPY
jgi:eukaryotic-like serine/threonine-protein kinase